MAETADLVFAVTEPACGGGVGRIGGAFELDKAGIFASLRTAEDGESFIGGECIGDVAEVDDGDDLLGCHIGEQTPDGFAFGLGVEVPDSVEQSSTREMDDAFLGAKPTELRVTGDLQIEGFEVVGDGLERATFYVGREVFEST